MKIQKKFTHTEKAPTLNHGIILYIYIYICIKIIYMYI